MGRFTKLLFVLSLLPGYLSAAITAEVDKTSVYAGDKVTLTLQADRKLDSRPELRPLNEHFHIIGSKQVTVSQYTTGTVKAKTRWIINLRPLNEGEVFIPELSIAGEKTPSIALKVLPAAFNPLPVESSAQPFYMQASLDQDKVHVNSEAIMRIKVFHLNDLPLDATLSPARASNTLIKALDAGKKYDSRVKGRLYNVTEYTYALYPKSEGTVEVEPFFFSGTLPNRELLELTSPLLLLSVMPAPSHLNSTKWLPARDIYIEDNLPAVTSATEGKALTRIISMQAEGLPASALPVMSQLQYPGVKIELLNVVLEEQTSEKGLVSSRTEEVRITPLQSETLSLPAIEIPWWNTATQQLVTAAIETRTLQTVVAKPAVVATPVEPDQVNSSAGSTNLLIWILTGISIIATLGFIYTFNQLRTRKEDRENSAETEHERQIRQAASAKIAEQNQFQALAIACNQNNPEIAQARLIEWAQTFWDSPNIHTFEELCEHADDQTFNYVIMDLEQHLYGHDSDLWRGDLLLDSADRLRQRRKRQQRKLTVENNQFVPTLYPEAERH